MESAEVTAALQSSRYNDTVVVNVSAAQEEKEEKEAQQRELLLIPCLDEDNGGVIWNDLAAADQAARQQDADDADPGNSNNNDDDPMDIGIVRHLRTKRWFFPMLKDARRNELYEAAIQAACYKVVRQKIRAAAPKTKSRTSETQQPTPQLPTIRVLDIGSGTGLLAMLAAKYVQQALDEQREEKDGASSSSPGNSGKKKAAPPGVQVTSLEMSAAMSRLARLTVSDNHMQDEISILEHHSTDPSSVIPNEQQQHYHYDLCVSELLESSLLGEGMLPALRDAWDRHLNPDATMVPQKARVFCQLVEGPFLANYWGPHSSSASSSSADNSLSTPELSLCLSANNNNDQMLGGGARGGFVLHIHADHWVNSSFSHTRDSDEMAGSKGCKDLLSSSPNETEQKLKPLSDPFEVMDFDFSRPGVLPGSEGRRLPTRVLPHTSGTCHGVLFWWELDLWSKDKNEESYRQPEENVGSCTYSTKVGKEPWQDHWHQNLFVFAHKISAATGVTGEGKVKDKREVQFGYNVQAEEACRLIASHDDTSIWFSMMNEASIPNSSNNVETTEDPPIKRRKRHDNSDVTTTELEYLVVPAAEAVASNTFISPARAWQLNDEERITFFQSGIRAALRNKGKDAVVLDLSDFSLCAMLAALEGASRVSSLESSSGVIPNLSARVAQLANGLPRSKESGDASGDSKSNLFQILQCHAEQLTLELLNGGEYDPTGKSSDPVEVVIAEPYYELLEGWHLQEALNYFYLVRALKRRGILSETAISVPSVAIIRGCAIQSFQLNSAYSRCGEDRNDESKQAPICGFDHSRANQYGDRFHQHDLSLPMWEFDFVEMTQSFDILELYYDSKDPEKEPTDMVKVRVPFQLAGVCHGMIVWIDYGISTSISDNKGDKDGMMDGTIGYVGTRKRPYRQLLRMLSKPATLTTGDVDLYELVCNFQCGRQTRLESHKFDVQVEKKC